MTHLLKSEEIQIDYWTNDNGDIVDSIVGVTRAQIDRLLDAEHEATLKAVGEWLTEYCEHLNSAGFHYTRYDCPVCKAFEQLKSGHICRSRLMSEK